MSKTQIKKNYNTMSHWDTTVPSVSSKYVPESYTALEWQTKNLVERKSDPLWEHAAFEYDYDNLDM